MRKDRVENLDTSGTYEPLPEVVSRFSVVVSRDKTTEAIEDSIVEPITEQWDHIVIDEIRRGCRQIVSVLTVYFEVSNSHVSLLQNRPVSIQFTPSTTPFRI